MAAALSFVSGSVALTAAVSFALNLGHVVERSMKPHLEWRSKVGKRWRWLAPPVFDERRLSRAVLTLRIGFGLVFLLMAVLLLAAGISGVG